MRIQRINSGSYYAHLEGHVASIDRTREGSLYSSDVMWVVKINGEHSGNYSTLNEAKRDVGRLLAETVDARAKEACSVMAMTTKISARLLRPGHILPQLRGGFGTVTDIVAFTAKTITVKVEYDDQARKTNGNQAYRTNRHSLDTQVEVVRNWDPVS